MAATDKFTKSYSFLQKSLAATIDDNDTTITLNNYTNIPTDTKVHFIIDRIDSNGNRTNSTRELCSGDCNGSNISNVTRGLHGTTAQSHSSGAIVEFVLSGAAWNDLIAGILVEHNQDGTHSDITATSVSTDTITEKTAAAGVTIDGLQIKDGSLETAGSVNSVNVDFGGAGAGIWWEEIGRTTLGSAGDTITVNNIPARKYIEVTILLINSGQLDASVRFNNDSGSNYANIRVPEYGTATDDTSTTSINLDTTTVTSCQYIRLDMINVASVQKYGTAVQVDNGGADAVTTAPNTRVTTFKWNNTTDQVTRIDVLNGGTGDFASGSEVIVRGHN